MVAYLVGRDEEAVDVWGRAHRHHLRDGNIGGRQFAPSGRRSTRRAHSALHGEALLAAQSDTFQPLLDHLAAVAQGQDGIRAEVAGNLAGDWSAHPEARIGHELIAAGLLILAGITDRRVVAETVRVGYERGKGSLQGYDPTDATG